MRTTVDHPVSVLIASPIEEHLVERVSSFDGPIELLYAPELLPLPRYEGDHNGTLRDLTRSQSIRWDGLLARAEVSFDFDPWEPEAMPVKAPRLRWVQGTSAGIGEFVRETGLDRSDLLLTTAAGTHSAPLAEFALLGLLYLARDIPKLRRQQHERIWGRYTTGTLQGRTVLIVGLGHVGRAVASTLHDVGVTVWGAVRSGRERELAGVSRVIDIARLRETLPMVDAVVLACPLTSETEGLIGEAELQALRPGAFLVNIARGQVVDEPAMIRALEVGVLGGAVLDVFATEPLPAESPLWAMPNVLISPHSASTLADENERIFDLFLENLRRYVDGRPLINVYQRDQQY